MTSTNGLTKICHVISLSFLFAVTSISNVNGMEKEKLIFSVHPFKPIIKLHRMFKPLLVNLEQQLDVKIEFRSGKSYDEVIELYKEGISDFGYLGPAGYAKASKDFPIEPLVRIMAKGKGTFQGVIIVKKGSTIHTIKDLRQKRFAFGDPSSTLSHYVPHDMLMNNNIFLKDLDSYAFTGKHDNVAWRVAWYV